MCAVQTRMDVGAVTDLQYINNAISTPRGRSWSTACTPVWEACRWERFLLASDLRAHPSDAVSLA